MWAYLRPAGLIDSTGGVDSEGRFTALELHNYNSGAAGIEALYEIPNSHIRYQHCASPFPSGFYRSLAAPAPLLFRRAAPPNGAPAPSRGSSQHHRGVPDRPSAQ